MMTALWLYGQLYDILKAGFAANSNKVTLQLSILGNSFPSLLYLLTRKQAHPRRIRVVKYTEVRQCPDYYSDNYSSNTITKYLLLINGPMYHSACNLADSVSAMEWLLTSFVSLQANSGKGRQTLAFMLIFLEKLKNFALGYIPKYPGFTAVRTSFCDEVIYGELDLAVWLRRAVHVIFMKRATASNGFKCTANRKTVKFSSARGLTMTNSIILNRAWHPASGQSTRCTFQSLNSTTGTKMQWTAFAYVMLKDVVIFQ